jgi:hypothetical protein
MKKMKPNNIVKPFECKINKKKLKTFFLKKEYTTIIFLCSNMC